MLDLLAAFWCFRANWAFFFLLFFFCYFSFGLRGFSDTQVACTASEVVSPNNFSVRNITCKRGLVQIRAGKCFPDTKHSLASSSCLLVSWKKEKQWRKKKSLEAPTRHF
uniref:Putative secreted protein n=1 Tax=Ixodes ricinus TaxID=34613 RepID=A0A6B0UHD5_IXORI